MNRKAIETRLAKLRRERDFFHGKCVGPYDAVNPCATCIKLKDDIANLKAQLNEQLVNEQGV